MIIRPVQFVDVFSGAVMQHNSQSWKHWRFI